MPISQMGQMPPPGPQLLPDDERAADLNRTIRELRCNRIDQDERKLRLAYRGDAAMQLLDETADALGW